MVKQTHEKTDLPFPLAPLPSVEGWRRVMGWPSRVLTAFLASFGPEAFGVPGVASSPSTAASNRRRCSAGCVKKGSVWDADFQEVRGGKNLPRPAGMVALAKAMHWWRVALEMRWPCLARGQGKDAPHAAERTRPPLSPLAGGRVTGPGAPDRLVPPRARQGARLPHP